MSILVLKSGILDTFQDTGRGGFRRLGINPSGAMDRHAARWPALVAAAGDDVLRLSRDDADRLPLAEVVTGR